MEKMRGYAEEEEGMEKMRGARGGMLLPTAANSASSKRERAREREKREQQTETDREIETDRETDGQTRKAYRDKLRRRFRV